MKVVPVPVHDDNFAYLLIDEASKKAAAVDPAVAPPVINKAEELGVKIDCVLTTHHHWDHAGGNKSLLGILPEPVEIYGGSERVEAVTKILKEGDVVQVGGIKVTSRLVPCHTTDHLLFFCEESGETPLVFTGDTLFIGGCGRFFEGTPSEMNKALNTVITGMPDNTLVYCGHEYTRSNLLFALDVEAGNQDLQKKFQWVQKTLSEGGHTIPSTIGDEKKFNPFMRLNSKELRENLGVGEGASGDEVMRLLREKKNSWKPKQSL
mmetsp:Transcript_36984/g.58180  ORF Transcript_36984/g.58180 Transcript_36984/m.58180 type:complete len:264 (-) Transcript_36984:122-913(-)